MVATINNFGGFYRTEQYIQEARLKGASVEAPCVNGSLFISTICGKVIKLGFQHVAQLEVKTVNAFLKERINNGAFTELDEFVNRVTISLEQVIILIRVNAFRFSNKSKHWLLWKAHFLLYETKSSFSHPKLFAFHNQTKNVAIPELVGIPYEDPMDEIEYLGFPLCSPF